METLESSRVCRLCGKHSGISINIFDKNESHVRKINAVLPIMVHEMDLLPKHMCHRCSYKLEEFHKFYIDCLKTDADLKSQLSWMRKEDSKERIGVPMVHIENLKIKEEPPEYDVYELEPIVENVNYINSMSSVTFPVNGVQTNSLDGMTYATYARCRCYREKEQGGNKLNRPLTRNHRVTSALNPQVGGALKNFERTASEVPATISSSSRTLVDGHQLRAACRNLLEDFDSRAASSAATEPNYSLKENSLEANVKNVMDESVSVTRNLRPRNVSVSYVSKKRCHPSPRAKKAVTKVARTELRVIPRIKVEKVEDVEGRSLRPRNTTVNYFHGRKRTPKIVDAAQQSNAYDVKRFKVSGSSQQEEKAVECRSGRISIKQEPSFDDLPETSSRSLDMSQACSGRILTPRKLSNISLKNSPLGYEKGNSSKTEDMFSPTKTFGRVEKKRTSRLAIRRLDAGCHSPKFLRSQDLHLRNGKVMFDGVARRSTKKLRRDFKVVGRTVTKKQVESGGNALLNVVRGATGAKRIAAMKMIDNYIKHYCEKCSVSFPNNELFKLHACYV